MAVVDCPRGVYVKGLSVHPVSHEEDALNLLFEARQPNITVPLAAVFGGLAEGRSSEAGSGWPGLPEGASALFVLSLGVWKNW